VDNNNHKDLEVAEALAAVPLEASAELLNSNNNQDLVVPQVALVNKHREVPVEAYSEHLLSSHQLSGVVAASAMQPLNLEDFLEAHNLLAAASVGHHKEHKVVPLAVELDNNNQLVSEVKLLLDLANNNNLQDLVELELNHRAHLVQDYSVANKQAQEALEHLLAEQYKDLEEPLKVWEDLEVLLLVLDKNRLKAVFLEVLQLKLQVGLEEQE